MKIKYVQIYFSYLGSANVASCGCNRNKTTQRVLLEKNLDFHFYRSEMGRLTRLLEFFIYMVASIKSQKCAVRSISTSSTKSAVSQFKT